jgi:hypothetical protein
VDHYVVRISSLCSNLPDVSFLLPLYNFLGTLFPRIYKIESAVNARVSVSEPRIYCIVFCTVDGAMQTIQAVLSLFMVMDLLAS